MDDYSSVTGGTCSVWGKIFSTSVHRQEHGAKERDVINYSSSVCLAIAVSIELRKAGTKSGTWCRDKDADNCFAV
ncbi:hypothetical protein KL940_005222 [Ogataea angusta]|uniref:Uncharacterized protein n=1 Tax=Pichia angusta TaxID=870730 RepID=A0ABQ7RPT6_PICAN|nr:hypothetical protein KL940_005222 [Ogataea angusta]